tara:strand:- start:3977 stop:4645 length:669 start_codon:yes stop_codon:yes gene_type:complete
MRIAISGTGSIGKQRLLRSLLKKYESFETPETNFKHVIDAIYKESIENERETSSADIQWNILNYMLDTMQEYDRDSKVIFNCCTLDNVIHSLFLMEKNPDSEITPSFIDKCVPIVRESMKYLDIVFLLPITKSDKSEHKFTSEDIELNNLYSSLHEQYVGGESPFLPKDDQPAIIEIFGSEEQRLKMVELYLDEDGEVIFDKSISDLIDPAMVELQEQVSKQ